MKTNETVLIVLFDSLIDDVSKHIDELVNKKNKTEFEKGVLFGIRDVRKELRKFSDEHF